MIRNLKKYFSIGAAAKAAGVTAETLRHYDRIGLVQPCKKDEWTNYRYYTETDIVRVNTIRALQTMDLSLKEIKKVLEYDDLRKIVDFLNEAEKKADEKIASLQYSKSRIQAAKTDYENKLQNRKAASDISVRFFNKRVIMLSDTLETPTLDNLWDYLHHFYANIPEDKKDQFFFEDTAGVYTHNGISRLFAVCIRHGDTSDLTILPAGDYLCADASEKDKTDVINKLTKTAETEYGITPEFTVQQIVVSGILHWHYNIQIPIFGGTAL